MQLRLLKGVLARVKEQPPAPTASHKCSACMASTQVSHGESGAANNQQHHTAQPGCLAPHQASESQLAQRIDALEEAVNEACCGVAAELCSIPAAMGGPGVAGSAWCRHRRCLRIRTLAHMDTPALSSRQQCHLTCSSRRADCATSAAQPSTSHSSSGQPRCLPATWPPQQVSAAGGPDEGA